MTSSLDISRLSVSGVNQDDGISELCSSSATKSGELHPKLRREDLSVIACPVSEIFIKLLETWELPRNCANISMIFKRAARQINCRPLINAPIFLMRVLIKVLE